MRRALLQPQAKTSRSTACFAGLTTTYIPPDDPARHGRKICYSYGTAAGQAPPKSCQYKAKLGHIADGLHSRYGTLIALQNPARPARGGTGAPEVKKRRKNDESTRPKIRVGQHHAAWSAD